MGNHTGSRNECRHLVSPTHALFAGSQGPWRAQVWVCLFVPLGVLKKLINTKTSPEIYSDGDQSQEHKHNTTSSTSFFLLLHKLFVMAFSFFLNAVTGCTVSATLCKIMGQQNPSAY